MPENQPADFEIKTYEPLIHSTARRFEDRARVKGVEFDDLVQILRIRVWRALVAYNPERSSMTVRRFVFGCLTNQVKDVLKKKKVHNDLYLDDILPPTEREARASRARSDTSRNALKFLSISEEAAYAELNEDDILLPGSLTDDERLVALLLIENYTHALIADQLEMRLIDVRAHIRSIRAKMGPEDAPDPG